MPYWLNNETWLNFKLWHLEFKMIFRSVKNLTLGCKPTLHPAVVYFSVKCFKKKAQFEFISVFNTKSPFYYVLWPSSHSPGYLADRQQSRDTGSHISDNWRNIDRPSEWWLALIRDCIFPPIVFVIQFHCSSDTSICWLIFCGWCVLWGQTWIVPAKSMCLARLKLNYYRLVITANVFRAWFGEGSIYPRVVPQQNSEHGVHFSAYKP